MQLVVWNSQGAKWDTFWDYYANPLTATGEDVVGMLLESGWAPWVRPGIVFINAGYDYDKDASWFRDARATSSWCRGIARYRGRFSFWVPWVNTPGDFQPNSRCSLGGLFLNERYQSSAIDQIRFNGHKRPVVRMRLTRAGTTALTILLVHLISGYWPNAQAELDNLVAAMYSLIPEGTPGVVVGDMNIDLLTVPLTIPPLWRVLRTGVATQQSGGELDWALLFDPNQHYANATAQVVDQFGTGHNPSDHSVLRYTIPIEQ